ncbi:MAG: dethiobiotin synthase [Elusimicrobia bacterium RIFCSPLOWO2_02_FULL_39_32]|nr:MAG: dethiobiotin synthase [Elusimicrobia bacterium GWA2_38_7]OGR78972.1 MAG: dethiobiotin synthase [Elusimicrobia bacterium RIFCSPHIGHO2_02_FULL_39_36]OGR92556.1 MAG: dethiobiotin synthase [Elusimicrobia bacterium RIFCSPLOWO2_02_FULL_39_32]OGR99204.1 MAG: dethiobiotin synthase [Elusimicrobia bacterium RIFCSPLOWO2_12_FULL_39_28]
MNITDKSLKGLFVTATGTGIGKTFFSCLLASTLKNLGIEVGVMKPFASGGIYKGVDKTRRLVSEDALKLKKAAGSLDSLSLINPICFKAPLCPYSASILEGKRISLNKVFNSYQTILKSHGFTIVEGIGGVRVPLAKNFELADLILKMNLPALVVVSSKLGTLNHTLLTLDYLKRKKIRVLGIVLNFFNKRELVDRQNLNFFIKAKVPILATLPRTHPPSLDNSKLLTTILSSCPIS